MPQRELRPLNVDRILTQCAVRVKHKVWLKPPVRVDKATAGVVNPVGPTTVPRPLRLKRNRRLKAWPLPPQVEHLAPLHQRPLLYQALVRAPLTELLK